MIYIVSRHAGAVEWLLQKVSLPAVHLEHLQNSEDIGLGDTVVGTLPINQVDAICQNGACYLHIDVDIPLELRGKELSARQLSQLGAMLTAYEVTKRGSDDVFLKMNDLLEREV